MVKKRRHWAHRAAALLIVLMLLLTPEGAMAARWEKNVVPVWDFTSEEWRPYVQATVEDFNAHMPPGVPRLSYVSLGELACDALPTYGQKGGVSVCASTANSPLGEPSWFDMEITGRVVSRVRIALGPEDAHRAAYATCHELMHAVTVAPDDYANPHLNESCVQGNLDHLGPWDIAYAEQVYRHGSGPRHGTGGKHHRAKGGRAR